MGAIPKPGEVVRRNKPVPCNGGCGTLLYEPYSAQCRHCHIIGYLIFRHAIGWPLTDEDKVRLGLT